MLSYLITKITFVFFDTIETVSDYQKHFLSVRKPNGRNKFHVPNAILWIGEKSHESHIIPYSDVDLNLIVLGRNS